MLLQSLSGSRVGNERGADVLRLRDDHNLIFHQSGLNAVKAGSKTRLLTRQWERSRVEPLLPRFYPDPSSLGTFGLQPVLWRREGTRPHIVVSTIQIVRFVLQIPDAVFGDYSCRKAEETGEILLNRMTIARRVWDRPAYSLQRRSESRGIELSSPATLLFSQGDCGC